MDFITLGIDIGSTTVKIAILDEGHNILFCDYERHYANIRETLSRLLDKACRQLGNLTLHPMITGSGGLTLANCLLHRPDGRSDPDRCFRFKRICQKL